MKPLADLTLAPARKVGGASARLGLSSFCLMAVLVFSYSAKVTAGCINTTIRAVADGGDACVASGASYGSPTISSSSVVSMDSGPPAITSLTLTAPDVTIISGGTASRAIRADGGNITFEGNVTVYRSPNGGYGATSNPGFGLEAHGRTPDRGSVVIFEKNATFLVDVLDGDGVQVSNGARASFLGFTDITAGRYGIYSRTITDTDPTYAPGSSLIELNNLKVRSIDEALKVNGALNNTIVVSGTLVDIETSGNNGRGIQAEDGGKVFVRGSGGVGSADGNSLIVVDTAGARVLTRGSDSHGLLAVSKVGDTRIELGSGAIETLGDNAEGIYSHVNDGTGDAYVSISGGSVTTTGVDADGVLAVVDNNDLFSSINGNASVVMTGGSVSASGDASAGLLAQTDASVLLTSQGNASVRQSGGSVITHGNTVQGSNFLGIPQGSYALSTLAIGVGNGEIVQSGGSAQTSGVGAHAIYSYASYGNNTINQGAGASAIATGADSSGLRAVAYLGGTNTLTINGTLTGGSGLAAALHSLSSTSSTITIGATAKVDGSASGIAIRDGDSDLNGVDDDTGGDASISIAGHVLGDVIMGLGNDSILLSGGILDGDIYGDDQTASAADGNDSFTWTGGAWLSSFYGGGGSDTVAISASSYDGTHHVLDGGDDLSAADGFIDRLTFQGISATAYGANLRNWELITFDNAAITITDGALSVGTEPTLGLFLTNGATLNGAQGLVLNGNLEIDGGSRFAGTGGGVGLYSVTGSLVHAGSISTRDGAAGDRFIAQADYQGNGGVVVLDTQLGADNSLTDQFVLQGNSQGSAQLQVINAGGLGAQTMEGIKVVDVQGNSNVIFSLQGDYLFEGDQAVVGGAYAYRLYQNGVSTPNDGDWYLRSTLLGFDPLYQAGVPLYENYAQHLLGLTTLPTLRQRVGERVWNDPVHNTAQGWLEPEDRATGVWGRVVSSHRKLEPHKSTSGSQYEQTVQSLQGGVDAVLWERAEGQLVGGVMAHYLSGHSDVSSRFGKGRIDTKGLGLGGTLTWYAHNGFYTDAQLQTTWYESDLKSKTAQRMLEKDNRAFAYAASLESGQKFALTESLSVTPQAQLVYANVSLDAFHDAFGAEVKYPQGESLRGRVGVSLDQQFNWDNHQARLYVIANVHRELQSKATVKVANTPFKNEIDPLWAEVGMGGIAEWDDGQYALFGELSYATGVEHSGRNRAVQGTVGLRVRW